MNSFISSFPRSPAAKPAAVTKKLPSIKSPVPSYHSTVNDRIAGRVNTVPAVLVETARLHGDAPALRQPQAGGYLTYSWKMYRQAMEEIAAGLRSIGIGKGDVVALNSETRLEFYLADLGTMANGSIAAAMYPSYPAPDLVRTLTNINAKAAFVEDAKTFHALRAGPVSQWILLTGEADGALSLDALRERGRSAMASDSEL